MSTINCNNLMCRCYDCRALHVFPQLPALDPPKDWRVGGSNWVLACNWLGPVIDGMATLIRKGLSTDGTSMPKTLWPILGHPFSLPLLPASLEHDALYASELLPRLKCDSRYADFQRDHCFIGFAKRNAVYSGVAAGGWVVWNKHTDESKAEARAYVSLVTEADWFYLNRVRYLES